MTVGTPTRATESIARTRLSTLLRQPLLAGCCALALGAVLSFGVARIVRDHWQSDVQARFERRTAHMTATMRHELQSDALVLQGARGAFVLDGAPLSPDRWQQYVAALDLDRSQSPIRRLGYVPFSPEIRAALASDGASAAMPHVAASLSAPPSIAAVTTFGPDDVAVLRRTAQSGEVTLGTRLMPDPSGEWHPALALLLSVYGTPRTPATAAARLPATDGVMYAVLDQRRLMQRTLDAERGIDLRLSAVGEARPVYERETLSDEAAWSPYVLSKTDPLTFGGGTLTLTYTADGRPSVTGAQHAANTVLLAGLAASLAFAAVVYAMAYRRARVPEAEPGGILSATRMMAMLRASMEAIITIDETQTVVLFNPKAEQMFGVSAMDAIGGPLSRFIPERFRATHATYVDKFGVTGVSERQMGRQLVLFGLRSNGEEFPIEASISQIHDASGKLYTVMLRDITARHRAENELRRSREELRELSANLQNVREEEKTRIARELHDDLGQQLTALKMDLSAVEQNLRDPCRMQDAMPVVQKQLKGMRRLIDATVASVRRIAADLRPVMLDDLGLVPAIEWLANDFTNRYGIDVERQIDIGGPEFTGAGSTTVFRIVQEALTNVARHAEATHVVLTLHVDGTFCILRIADNGRGAARDGPAREDKSFGLIGIRERAHMLGGTVTIDTGQAQGFAITVALPLSAIQQEISQT